MRYTIEINPAHGLLDLVLYPHGDSTTPALVGAAQCYQDAESAAAQFIAVLGWGGALAEADHAARAVIAAGGGTPFTPILLRGGVTWGEAVRRHQAQRLAVARAQRPAMRRAA